ncbi:MAG: hypothetical protein MJ003_00940 [Paludibacteraceae bacterium]|nr:hypothetical protein [Paludibacteraceae bacterium]
MKTAKLISIALAGALLVLSACKKDEPGSTPTSEKCKTSDYPQVTIGTQVWMAENYRCSKYDTQSEAYNASWLTNNTIPTSESNTYTPYYTDASDKSKWKSSEYAGNLTDTQIKKLGYLYNWAAAVGVADGQMQTTAFSGKRQGICPNGWHVPSRAEWQTLYDYIYSAQKLTSNAVGKYLKTTSGWYQNGNGLDSYGFAALPAGDAYGSSVGGVGHHTFFWTATTIESCSYGASYGAYNSDLYYDYDGLSDGDDGKGYGQSVRCLRD